MRAGTLRHRVTIQQDSGTADTQGFVVPSWSAFLSNEPAEVIQTGGAERLYGHTIDATATHVVRVRYRSTITERMRIVWGSRTFGIENVRDIDGRVRELWLMCREVKA